MKELVFNVECLACGQVFNPIANSPLWWKAKQRAEQGLLDALCVSGEKCGCEKKPTNPDAPFRVFGYDDECRDFNIPFDTFTGAVQKYVEMNRDGMYVVFISGVSERVRRQAEFM